MSVIISRQRLPATNGRFIEHRRGESEQSANDTQPVAPLAIADASSGRRLCTLRLEDADLKLHARLHTDRRQQQPAAAAVDGPRPLTLLHTSAIVGRYLLRRTNYVRHYVTACACAMPAAVAPARRPALSVATFRFFTTCIRSPALVAVQVAAILSLIMSKATDNCLSAVSGKMSVLANTRLYTVRNRLPAIKLLVELKVQTYGPYVSWFQWRT